MFTCESETIEDVGILPVQTDYLKAPTAGRILTIETPSKSILRHWRRRAWDYVVKTASTAADALERILNDPPDVILLDDQFADKPASEIHVQIKRIARHTPVIFVATLATADAVILAIKHGAYDYLQLPVENQLLQDTIARALAIGRRNRKTMPEPTTPFPSESEDEFCGTSQPMCEVYKMIGRVADQDVNVLITGESGTGKELVARAIHRNSSRCNKPFLALNCAAIPDNLLESELFGHEKGAFSGADRRRMGKFEQCDGGTILLDEIGDMPLTLQAKILRLIQEQSFERVGGGESIKTNVRVIASTHRDLKTWAKTEKFRADLYYRLGVFSIHLPPLRERAEDLPKLAHHFLRRYACDMAKDAREIAPDALERLRQHAWPGNIRELQSVIRQALLRSSGPLLLADFLPALGEEPPQIAEKALQPECFDLQRFLESRLCFQANNLYAELHNELDRHSLGRVLAHTRGSHRAAAEILGIARQTLRTRLRECGLQVTQSVEIETTDERSRVLGAASPTRLRMTGGLTK
jgi:two-component system nitrogen regulation response regulator GlnG